MIENTTTIEKPLTKVTKSAFGEKVYTELPEGTKVTWWMTEPTTIGLGVDMKWKIGLKAWVGDYTQKESEPQIELKEVSSFYIISLFNSDGTPKFPYEESEKTYIQGMVDNQSRLLVSFLYDNDIFDEGSLNIVGI